MDPDRALGAVEKNGVDCGSEFTPIHDGEMTMGVTSRLHKALAAREQ